MKRIYTYMCLLLLSVLSFVVTGCDDDDDDDVAKDLIELIVNKPVIRIGQNEEAKVNVVVGNGNYTVRSFNTAIATATVSGDDSPYRLLPFRLPHSGSFRVRAHNHRRTADMSRLPVSRRLKMHLAAS